MDAKKILSSPPHGNESSRLTESAERCSDLTHHWSFQFRYFATHTQRRSQINMPQEGSEDDHDEPRYHSVDASHSERCEGVRRERDCRVQKRKQAELKALVDRVDVFSASRYYPTNGRHGQPS